MKTLLVALAFVLLALPATVDAQDWVMDWHSTVNQVGTFSLSGTSPATLTPVSGGLPPTFSGQAYNLSFSYLGSTFGGLVAQGSFQDPGFSVPSGAPAPLNSFSTDFASGNFNISGNSFTLSAFLGTGHNNAEFTATGTRNTSTATAAEPSIMLFGAMGLVGAAVVRRSRKR